MADLISVGVTSGVPSSGTGTVATINQLIAVGAPISNGSTSAPVTVAITGSASAVTSTMAALVTTLSPNSSARTVALSSSPTVTLSSAIALSSGIVTLSSNPTVILSSNPTVIPSSAFQVTLTSNQVRGNYVAAQLTQASVSATTSGNNILVTRAVGTIKVYGLYAVPDNGVTIQFCNGSTALPLSGPMAISSITLPIQTEPYFTTTGSNNFVVNLSTSVQFSGMIYYLDN